MLKVRCSKLGDIMSNSRSKKEPLSATARKCIEEIFNEKELGVYKSFHSRFTHKGNLVENDGISLCNDLFDFGFLYKNPDSFENDYITGTPDVITDNLIIDIKSSYSSATFPFHDKELKNKSYYWQLQGYMWLTGKTESYVAYCLLDTPEDILNDEIRREHWNQRKIDESEEVVEYVNSLHKPSLNTKIPTYKRVKLFSVKYDLKEIEKIKQRIELCREYYNKLKAEFFAEKPLVK